MSSLAASASSSAIGDVGDDPPPVDDHDPVGEPLGLVEVVGGEQYGHASSRSSATSGADDPAALEVDTSRGFVEERHLRAARPGRGRARAVAALRPTAGATASRRGRSARPARAAPRGRADPGRARRRAPAPRAARMPGWTPPDCSMTPRRGRTARASATGSRPSTCTVPASGRRYPSIVSTVVVLPAPFGPSSTVTAPASAVKDASFDGLEVAVANDELGHLDARHDGDRRYRTPRGAFPSTGYRHAMLDVRRIRAEPEVVRAALARRADPASLDALDRVIELDGRHRASLAEHEADPGPHQGTVQGQGPPRRRHDRGGPQAPRSATSS